MSTFLRRLLDEGMERYLQAFDDEPSDGSDTAGLDELQRLAEKAKRDHEEGRTARLEPLANNDADDARTAQLLHDGTTVEADPDKTLKLDDDDGLLAWRAQQLRDSDAPHGMDYDDGIDEP